MSLTRFVPRRPAAWLTALIIAGACTAGVDRITGPSLSDHGPSRAVGSSASGVVISQVYGGGGNSGATYTNDFIELYNRGSEAVTIAGWSVQYASSTGSSWQVTALSGSIAPHSYYLVQEAKGSGGTTPLPTPDASATIGMSGSSGKVALVSSTTALSGTCPTAGAVDFVGFGSANCSEGAGPTGGLSNTTAAVRKEGGNTDNNDNSADFDVAAPNPRNSASPANGGTPVITGPLDHVTITGGAETLEIGASTQFSAAAQDEANQAITDATITWTSSDAAVVTVDETGKATGVKASTAPVTLTATAVSGGLTKTATATITVTAPIPEAPIVISQVYGGGGNSGATLKNDFIELFNTANAPVSLDGWSVQYASASGSSWSTTTLSGVIEPGGYYLVQEAAGSGGTDTLPTPNAMGSLNMSGSNGKVALVRSTLALSGACPLTSATLADLVGFGSANCAEGDGATPALSNTTAAIRKGDGTVDSDDNAADFDVAAPTPRNSSSPRAAVAGPLDHVTIAGGEATLAAGTSADFDASGRDAANVFIGSAKITWTSSNPAVATVDKTGLVKGLVASTTPVTLTATAVANGITKTATTSITIIPPPPVARITVSPADWSLKAGETKQFSAAPFDANGKPTVTTFGWSSANPAVATVDVNTGLVTGRAMGVVDITVTAANGRSASATVTVNALSTVELKSGKNAFALGMQTQFFYGGTDKAGAELTSVVWSTANPSIATVDQNGVVTGKAVGSTQLVATAPDGSVGSTGIKVYLAAGSSGVRLGHNTEFGEPKDGNASDDFLIRRAQYTVSYNQYHGGANWVSWNLDGTHLGSNGRCEGTCYSADTALANAGLTAYTTADWVSNVPGFDGYDRGHMTPSADWTSSEADNNTTFFLSNFLPQTHDMNAGPWEKLENALRDSVSGGREAYIIAGGNFGPDGLGKGTLLNKGKVAIPLSTWKVAVITPAGTGINADGTLPANSTVMAVDMPNVYGIDGDGFEKYLTTIDQIQRETGYDLLALLADDLECRVEARDCGAVTAGSNVAVYPVDPVTGTQPATITFGNVTTGGTTTLTSSITLPATVPSIPLFQVGSAAMYYEIATSAKFDAATVCISYPAALFADGQTPSLLHYVSGAWVDVTTSVSAAAHEVCGSVTSFSPFAVTVLTPAQRISLLSTSVTRLASIGKVTDKDAKWIANKLEIAASELAKGNLRPAANQLQEVLQRVDASMRAGDLSASDAAALTKYIQGTINAIS